MKTKNEMNSIEKNKIKKILVFKIGAIGDVLMTTPLMRDIRKNFPKAEIIYYVGKHASQALKGNKNIDRVEIFDDFFYSKNIFKAISLMNKIKKEKFNVAFVLDKHWVFGLFIKMCGIPIRVGFDRNGEGKYHTNKIIYLKAQHEIEYYLSLLEAIEIKPSKNTQIDLHIDKQDIKFADKFFKQNKISINEKTIGIFASGGGANPGESGSIRQFSSHKYMELMQKLSLNHKILLFGGKADKEFNQNIINFLKNKKIFDASCNTIQQTAALMKKCSLITTHDAGPMHIASAVNNKIITLFGPTNPVRKAPLHKESVAMWKDQDIYEEDYELYGKIPNKNKNNKWMQRITAKEIYEAATKMLGD